MVYTTLHKELAVSKRSGEEPPDAAYKVFFSLTQIKKCFKHFFKNFVDFFLLVHFYHKVSNNTPHFILKELSSWNKLMFLNLQIFSTQCCRPLMFQTMNSVK